jgi:hypothetical protein
MDGVFVAARLERFPVWWRPWTYYLLNDTDTAIESCVLELVGYEWGDNGSTRPLNRPLGSLGPRSWRKIWRDASSEVQEWLELEVTSAGSSRRLMFEFPRMYAHAAVSGLPPILGGKGILAAATPL